MYKERKAEVGLNSFLCFAFFFLLRLFTFRILTFSHLFQNRNPSSFAGGLHFRKRKIYAIPKFFSIPSFLSLSYSLACSFYCTYHVVNKARKLHHARLATKSWAEKMKTSNTSPWGLFLRNSSSKKLYGGVFPGAIEKREEVDNVW